MNEMNELNKVSDNNLDDNTSSNANEIDRNLAEAENEVFELAREMFKGYNLAWTFRSVDFILNKESVSFPQLRSCVYRVGPDVVFNHMRSTLILIKAGLVGSKQMTGNNYEELTNKAYEILEDWCSHFYSGTLHLLIIDAMQDKHFFMSEPDLAIVHRMQRKNSMKDTANNLVLDANEQISNQIQALS